MTDALKTLMKNHIRNTGPEAFGERHSNDGVSGPTIQALTVADAANNQNKKAVSIPTSNFIEDPKWYASGINGGAAGAEQAPQQDSLFDRFKKNHDRLQAAYRSPAANQILDGIKNFREQRGIAAETWRTIRGNVDAVLLTDSGVAIFPGENGRSLCGGLGLVTGSGKHRTLVTIPETLIQDACLSSQVEQAIADMANNAAAGTMNVEQIRWGAPSFSSNRDIDYLLEQITDAI